jgi:hypothetical protein
VGVFLWLKRLLAAGSILLLLAVGCGGGGGELDAAALSKHAGSLQSAAAEGALLAGDAYEEKTTAIFTREHAADLHGVARQVASSLKSARTSPDLEPQLHELTRLARRVSADLARLPHASHDGQRRLQRELQAAAAKSRNVAKALE